MDFVKIFEKQTNIFQPLMSSKLNLNFIPTISHANKGCIHYEKELLRGGGVELMFRANISANHNLRQLPVTNHRIGICVNTFRGVG